MPLIDFPMVESEIRIPRVLEHLGHPGLVRESPSGEYRGGCLLHGLSGKASRIFAVDPSGQRWYCHRCKIGGSVIDLWRETHPGLDAFGAALELCAQFIGFVPYQKKREQMRGTIAERSASERSGIPSSGPAPSQAVPDRHDLREE